MELDNKVCYHAANSNQSPEDMSRAIIIVHSKYVSGSDLCRIYEET
jgi:hypothetical protein